MESRVKGLRRYGGKWKDIHCECLYHQQKSHIAKLSHPETQFVKKTGNKQKRLKGTFLCTILVAFNSSNNPLVSLDTHSLLLRLDWWA